MDSFLIEALAAGGPVAILAGIIFFMYRKDRKDTERRIHDVHSAHSERLENLLEKDQETREDNTKALTELNILLRKLNGRK
ncbi:unnamed protein product [marine sediment metagenome]|uniref:Uncharacterized protein n=1 Tax=marine sediment metagenome TaxID=412755 RepID=X0ZUD1_9ZZZZ